MTPVTRYTLVLSWGYRTKMRNIDLPAHHQKAHLDALPRHSHTRVILNAGRLTGDLFRAAAFGQRPLSGIIRCCYRDSVSVCFVWTSTDAPVKDSTPMLTGANHSCPLLIKTPATSLSCLTEATQRAAPTWNKQSQRELIGREQSQRSTFIDISGLQVPVRQSICTALQSSLVYQHLDFTTSLPAPS